ncbi:MAG: hypothetical protein JO308_05500 [Verrucomicrobia bacterium]|nr:hypothetical protein [Verrucomicrobiota bacterium]
MVLTTKLKRTISGSETFLAFPVPRAIVVAGWGRFGSRLQVETKAWLQPLNMKITSGLISVLLVSGTLATAGLVPNGIDLSSYTGLAPSNELSSTSPDGTGSVRSVGSAKTLWTNWQSDSDLTLSLDKFTATDNPVEPALNYSLIQGNRISFSGGQTNEATVTADLDDVQATPVPEVHQFAGALGAIALFLTVFARRSWFRRGLVENRRL